jgi:hypothetical protein
MEFPHIDHVEGKPVLWSIQLNRYQRDNLLWALQSIRENRKVENFNTGDWVGEVANMLAKKGKFPEIDVEDSPNSPLGPIL